MVDKRFDDLPVDPDIGDIRTPASLRELLRGRWDVLAVIAAGGAVGGGLRWLVGQALPTGSGGFPWSTVVENVSGCLLLGALMVLVIEVWHPRRYARPFWGIGVLGGYTTFSAYTAETLGLLREGAPGLGMAYLFGTLAAGLVAVWAGMLGMRALTIGRAGDRPRGTA